MSRRGIALVVSMFALLVAATIGLLVGATEAQAQRPGGMNPQMQQQMLLRFDKNSNGVLDPDELQAAQQAMQQMGGGGGRGMGMGGRPGMPGGPGGPGGGGGGGGGMMNPQMQRQMIQRFDKNGNGVLDPDEQQAAQQAMQQMRGGGMGLGGRPGMPGGQGGGGMMNPQMQQQMMQRFDKNGNGTLDPDEKQALQQAIQQMRGGGGMGGPPGAGGQGRGAMAGMPPAGGATKGKTQATNAAQDKQLQLLRFDKNGNGKLEPDELKASRDAATTPAGCRSGRATHKNSHDRLGLPIQAPATVSAPRQMPRGFVFGCQRPGSAVRASALLYLLAPLFCSVPPRTTLVVEAGPAANRRPSSIESIANVL